MSPFFVPEQAQECPVAAHKLKAVLTNSWLTEPWPATPSENAYWLLEKVAVIFLSPFIEIVNGFVLPVASPVHPVKVNPSAGEAVTETLVFSLKVPPEVLTLPPSEAATARVNLVRIGVGTTASGIGLSLEQANRIKKQIGLVFP